MAGIDQIGGTGLLPRVNDLARLFGLITDPAQPVTQCFDVARVPDLEIMGMGAPAGVASPLWNLAGTAERRELWQSAQIAAGDALPAANAAAVTADQLRAVMPNAGTRADVYAATLGTAMTAHGIETPQQRAAFLAQISVESGDLRSTIENLNYSAQRMTKVWPGRYPSIAAATPYARNPEALGNHTYANRNGNGNEASGDGYLYRGRGLMQITGRANYAALGFEANPAALSEPATAANTAAAFFANNGLVARTETTLGRADFNAVSRTVNGGNHGSDARWQAYQRALTALSPAP